MTNHVALPTLAQHVIEVVQAAMAAIRPRLLQAALSGDVGESENVRHADNFLSVHDMWMHRQYRDGLADRIASFVYASEEAEPEVIGDNPDPDLCVLVDPLDTSELAVRGLHGYTHVMVYSRSMARPVVAVVGDIYHQIRMYVAARHVDGTDRAHLVTADGVHYPLRPLRPQKAVEECLVTNYLMRPAERFAPLARQERLIHELSQPGVDGKRRGRIGVDFGSVGLCHVAAGFTDVMIEFAKGFAIWDLAPGHYILHAAGGTVLDLDAKPVSLDYGLSSLHDIRRAMDPRQKFVAARTTDIAGQMVRLLDRSSLAASRSLKTTTDPAP